MGAIQTETQPETVTLKLRSGDGFVCHTISAAPARESTRAEIPLIDLTNIDGSVLDRKNIAREVQKASEHSGFFYISNHGIERELIQRAHDQAKRFFKQPNELKAPGAKTKSTYLNNGWSESRTSHVNPTESLDSKESFGWSYSPEYDPLYDNQSLDPRSIDAYSQDEDHVWSSTSHLHGFKTDTLAYWQACLLLARKLLSIFALSLDLPEDYFASVTTFPGADGVYNFYPISNKDPAASASLPSDVGLGSHTDLQCFTLLWQDMHGGLQILNQKNEWIWATPIEDTFVVNIGDFLSRLTNDRYRSTIHRAYNRESCGEERISMPFFFGFNYDAICAVLPSCVDENNPAKYEPISCGQWRQLRFSESRRLNEQR